MKLPPPPGGGAARTDADRGAVFFDLDRTLMAGSSAFQFARAAFNAGLVDRRTLARDAWENILFRLRGSTDAGTDALRERIGKQLEGARLRDLQRLGRSGAGRRPAAAVPAHARDRLRAPGRRAARSTSARPPHRRWRSCSRSCSPSTARSASRSEIVDGHYTGRSGGRFTYREGKAEAIRELAAKEDIDLAASYAYSDSESDLPMLRLVGHPVVVNPDSTLARVAGEQGWEVLRFERIGTRLRVAAFAVVAAVAGGAGGAVVTRRRVGN